MTGTILGMSTAVYTVIHVVTSLIGIFSGLLVILGMLGNKRWPLLTGLFLITTILTSVGGFFFPFHGVTPGIVVGIISLVILAVALVALYGQHLAGSWRRIYVVTAMIAEYLNCFVLIVQSFQKIPALHALAPTGTELPFKVAQVSLLVIFIALTVQVDKKFRPVTA